MKTKTLILFCMAAFVFASCNNSQPDSVRPVSKTVFSGKVQKGPFAEGSSVDIISLDKDLSQTGQVFTTTIRDKQGTFEQRNLQLSSQYVELRATGYYFNEVSGKLSEAPLTLSAVADLADVDNVNVNILTTLERGRILNLTSNGISFQKAKQQAHKEVLALFGMKPSDVDNAEMLDIEEDAQLLAVSAIVQGLRPTAEVTRLISNIASDLSEDGTLDNAGLASVLKNNASNMKAETLVKNMRDYDIVFDYSAQDVEVWLESFDKNTSYKQTEFVEYPAEGKYGVNVLAEETEFFVNEYYSFAATTPAWASLSIMISGEMEWYFQALPAAPQNWDITEFAEGSINTQTFTVIEPGKESDLKFHVKVPGTLTFTYYEYGFEPTQVKEVNFNAKDEEE